MGLNVVSTLKLFGYSIQKEASGKTLILKVARLENSCTGFRKYHKLLEQLSVEHRRQFRAQKLSFSLTLCPCRTHYIFENLSCLIFDLYKNDRIILNFFLELITRELSNINRAEHDQWYEDLVESIQRQSLETNVLNAKAVSLGNGLLRFFLYNEIEPF